MKSWIQEITESYFSTRKPVRKDLKENYNSLTEKERFNLLSDNITSYFNEQIKNAYGFSLNDITQEQAGALLKSLFEEGVGKYDGPAPDEGSTVVPEDLDDEGRGPGHPDYIKPISQKKNGSSPLIRNNNVNHQEPDKDRKNYYNIGSTTFTSNRQF